MSSPSSPYLVLKIPKDPTQNTTNIQLAKRFRALRLESLQANPKAFGSSYEAEVDRPLQATLDRLQNPNATHFIAIRSQGDGAPSTTSSGVAPESPPQQNELRSLLESEWVGMMVLVGPREVHEDQIDQDETLKPNFEHRAPDLSARSKCYAERSLWWLEFHINATFVSESARRAGLGMRLMRRTMEVAAEQGRIEGMNVRVRVVVNEQNESARDLYLKAGFAVVGETKYTQAPRNIDGVMRELEMIAIRMKCDVLFESDLTV